MAFNNHQGYSWYHAMQTLFEKRFAAGYTFNVAWTWSKFMQATGYLNGTDPAPERVVSGQDRTHRVVITALGELPFGRGRRFGSGARGILGRLIGDLKNIPLAKDQRTVDRWFKIDAGFERSSSQQPGSNIRTLPSRFQFGLRNGDFGIPVSARHSVRC
jgi:hypothetical protein